MEDAFKSLRVLQFYDYFCEIAAIPRESGNEKEISKYVTAFAEKNQLAWQQDEKGNVVIKKPASHGREMAAPVALQCHMDMVCEKAAGSRHDFKKDPIRIMSDGIRLYAQDTTLGADNAVGMAYILEILADKALVHPPLEAIFTTGEEVGMEGMAALDSTWITAARMINLDGEEEGVIYTSCAGGTRYNITGDISGRLPQADRKCFRLTLGNLTGGHSGLEIDKGYGNAIVMLARIVQVLLKQFEIQVSDFVGGTKTNAIPRQATVQFWVDERKEMEITEILTEYTAIFKGEYGNKEPALALILEKIEEKRAKHEVWDEKALNSLLDILLLAPNGLVKSSAYLQGAVETSANLGVIETGSKKWTAAGLVRASRQSGMADILMRLNRLADRASCRFEVGNRYPAWEHHPDSPLWESARVLYSEINGHDPKRASIHGGLECALMLEKKNQMDMISLGPNLDAVHTIHESADILSIIRIRNYLIKLLEVL